MNYVNSEEVQYIRANKKQITKTLQLTTSSIISETCSYLFGLTTYAGGHLSQTDVDTSYIDLMLTGSSVLSNVFPRLLKKSRPALYIISFVYGWYPVYLAKHAMSINLKYSKFVSAHDYLTSAAMICSLSGIRQKKFYREQLSVK